MTRRVVTAAAIFAAPESDRYSLSLARGAANERRVLAALQWLIARNPGHWIRMARPATEWEDRCGADIVVVTEDDRVLWLQVKSSEKGFADFLARMRRPIAVVVVRDEDQRVQLAAKAEEALRRIR